MGAGLFCEAYRPHFERHTTGGDLGGDVVEGLDPRRRHAVLELLDSLGGAQTDV